MDYNRVAEMLDKVFAYSLSRTFSREEAEELTQEILYQALKNLHTLRDKDKFDPWFWRLADITLKVFQRGKARSRSLLSFDDVNVPSYEDSYTFVQEEQLQQLRRRIAYLSASYRDIIVMHYYDGLTCKKISQILGLPEGTVTYRLSMARNKLKKEYSVMNETALKPIKLTIRISGEFNSNGEDRPFPWSYIDDALSQNILWHAYREPKTIEELAYLTGVPAYFIEDRVDNLIKREAMIQPTKTTYQTDFLIFDDQTSKYSEMNNAKFVSVISEKFYTCAKKLTEHVLELGVNPSGRSFDEMLCLLSVIMLDQFVPAYSPCEYKRIPLRYDGNHWEYKGFVENGNDNSSAGMGMEKSLNNFESGKLAHYSYHFSPFIYRKMMYTHEIDVCHSILNGDTLTENQKEVAAKLIADGYLKKDEDNRITVSMPIFTAETFDQFLNYAKEAFADVLPLYAEEVKNYLSNYIRIFPSHLKDAASRNGFHIFVSLFKAVAADWINKDLISIPNGAVCDALIMHK